ncbi:exported heme-molybdoenzyme molybdopterin-containing subunit YedY; TAT export [Candidatus Terasakiella magnetica]|uniref:Protein-methionine-sulfoxide reductase catalytic subunit MsrP n=1 Tax=Candidatus Terasakiella magnetica TaxID=1867952 RepID=A0A1C3RDU5_9PROT|nr:protein-methionine-sulfoxide reductase catalytic subunit MsrP [Candidatus Terasakiella magnetica]SCA55467.1 exported heme-molybdoenzyme molybdopterin-containing subunit YedY; TAT export [Candidatus Terasakiella magnetica]
MLIKNTIASDPKSFEITPKSVYLDRRRFLQMSVGVAGAALMPWSMRAQAAMPNKIDGIIKSPFSTDEPINKYDEVTGYNNFYEFGTGKTDPIDNSAEFKARPWAIQVDGLCDKPGTLDIEELMKFQQEERIYRMRCVEAWSMVIPWVGVELGSILKKFEPNSKAKYVEFTTLVDEKQFPAQKYPIIPWPYIEGLRLDEAMHPLTLLATGIFGEELPTQNGAPVRLVVPWKYGFKSIKSIVRIRFVEEQPTSTWMKQAPNEYGFYANVNPQVDHPRWTQSKERRIGEFFRQPTAMFNGYGEEVASLYKDMDLRKSF